MSGESANVYLCIVVKWMQSVIKFCSSACIFCIEVFPHHATNALLHWLKVPERIEFKLAVLVHICLHQTVPPYLAEEFHQSSADESHQHLRLTLTSLLVVQCTSLQPLAIKLFLSLLCPTMEHCAAERHIVIVNVCNQEMFEDPSLQSFFPESPVVPVQ